MVSIVCDEQIDQVQPTDNAGIIEVVRRVAADIGDAKRERTFKDAIFTRLAISPSLYEPDSRPRKPRLIVARRNCTVEEEQRSGRAVLVLAFLAKARDQ